MSTKTFVKVIILASAFHGENDHGGVPQLVIIRSNQHYYSAPQVRDAGLLRSPVERTVSLNSSYHGDEAEALIKAMQSQVIASWILDWESPSTSGFCESISRILFSNWYYPSSI